MGARTGLIQRLYDTSADLMSPDARSLHCPNCGAAAAPSQAACGYCRAALATVSCPSCFALMFEGSIYCPACGARRARAEGGPRQAPCPSCRGVMREVLLGDTALLECERCRGMWVDARTFEHICASNEAQAAVLHQWPSKRPDVTAPVQYRKCVACAKIMNRINFGRLSGAVVDVCQRHGTFLDAGELNRIVDFIRQGGLDRARQRQIQELREEEERLRAIKTGHQLQRHTMGRPVEITFETHQWTGPDMMWLLEKLKDLK